MNRDEHLEQIKLRFPFFPHSGSQPLLKGADSMAMELDYDYLAKLVERTDGRQ